MDQTLFIYIPIQCCIHDYPLENLNLYMIPIDINQVHINDYWTSESEHMPLFILGTEIAKQHYW